MDIRGTINFMGILFGIAKSAIWGPSFIKVEDWEDSPPPQQQSPDSQSQRVEEWRQQVWESISGFTQGLQDDNSELKGKICAIMIRHSESFDDIKEQLEDIRRGGNDVSIREWAENWINLIDAIMLNNLSRNLISKELALMKGILTEQSQAEFERVNIQHEESIALLKADLRKARATIQEQIELPQYQRDPCVRLLQYMDQYWKSLTVFVDSPQVPIEAKGITFEFTIPKFQDSNFEFVKRYLHVGTPAAIYIVPEGRTWSVGPVIKAENLPDGDKEHVDVVTKSIVEVLKQCLPLPSPVPHDL